MKEVEELEIKAIVEHVGETEEDVVVQAEANDQYLLQNN